MKREVQIISQTLLNDDLNVITNSDFEITFLNGDLNIIQKLDDEPNDVGGLTAAELKAKFDESGLTIQKYINQTLIPELLAEEAVENARIFQENQRISNEQIRIANENARIAAEQSRVNINTGIVAQATAQATEAKKQANRAEAAASGGNHASRHTVNGPDPITPAAIGAAPSGFGLGGIAEKTLTTMAEIDAFKVNGVAYVDLPSGGTSDRIEKQGYGILECVATNRYYKQTFSYYYKNNGGLSQMERIWYIYDNINWMPWEWVNPPMLSGVEYRTIERYFGKPVYMKKIEIPALGNNAQVTARHNISGFDRCISISGATSDGYNLIGFSKISAIFCGKDLVAVQTNYDLTSVSAQVILKYTKA